YFRANKMTFKPVVIEKVEEVRAAFFAGRCDVFTTDASALYSTRAANAPNPDDYIILPEIISKEPLGPLVRHGDNQFADIVRWTLFAQIEAEEYGITSEHIDEMMKSDNPTIKRILGVTPGMGKALGVDEKWVYNIVKQVGNYGESFERNVGKDSPLKIDRGLNRLWTKGGLQYAPPTRVTSTGNPYPLCGVWLPRFGGCAPAALHATDPIRGKAPDGVRLACCLQA